MSRAKNELAIGIVSAKYVAAILTRRTTQRTASIVRSEYGRTDSTHDWNLLSQPAVVRSNGQLILVNQFAVRRQYIRILHDAILSVGASSILEVGCGDGVNIGLLSVLYPDTAARLQLCGFDLVEERVRRATSLLSHLNLRNATVWRGDATEPYSVGTRLDLVYSVHAIEQLHKSWASAIEQMGRSGRHLLLIEPFYERKSVAGKLHTLVHGYFQGKIHNLTKSGFSVVNEYSIELQDPFNRSTALLLSAPKS
jgi:protein-L-isoaspartate O-methyltransferase